MMSETILIVEDDKRFAARLQKNLSIEGYEITSAESGEDALDLLKRQEFDLVISDVKMPGMSGIDLLNRIKENYTDDDDIPVIMLTSVNSVEVAVDSMKSGAVDFLTKDAGRDEIILRIEKALSDARVRDENSRLRSRLKEAEPVHDFIARDPKSKQVIQEIETVAETGAGVLITGETGVGKDLVARYIHNLSPRSQQSFVDVNCAALPTDNLFQSEVFGHEKGAFTGATERKRGKLELADQGTLFLDEIGDMPLESQGKILRALETQEFERVGGSRKIKVDINVIAATNKHLEREVEEGRFRQDLLFRLDVIRINIPPLRERPDDVLPLCNHFFAAYAGKYRRQVPSITNEAEAVLAQYAFPGNVRELKNLAERIIIRHRNCEVIDAGLLRQEGVNENKETQHPPAKDGGQMLPLEEMEKQYILQALEKTNWVQSDAAKLLGISADRMHNRVKKFQLSQATKRG